MINVKEATRITFENFNHDTKIAERKVPGIMEMLEEKITTTAKTGKNTVSVRATDKHAFKLVRIELIKLGYEAHISRDNVLHIKWPIIPVHVFPAD